MQTLTDNERDYLAELFEQSRQSHPFSSQAVCWEVRILSMRDGLYELHHRRIFSTEEMARRYTMDGHMLGYGVEVFKVTRDKLDVSDWKWGEQ